MSDYGLFFLLMKVSCPFILFDVITQFFSDLMKKLIFNLRKIIVVFGKSGNLILSTKDFYDFRDMYSKIDKCVRDTVL